MKIVVLGTGHGSVTKCYNTCFALEKNDEYFLVDTGGGNGIINNLKAANIEMKKIKNIFISHTHIDHILGVIWIVREYVRYYNRGYEIPLNLYGNDLVINAIKIMSETLIPAGLLKYVGTMIKLNIVENGDKAKILDNDVTFIDLNAFKVKQFGFIMNYSPNKQFAFLGDEVCNEKTEKYIKDCEWIFSDAYMAGKEAEEYNPIERHHHSTVKFVAEMAERLNIKNIILSHSTDNDLEHRKQIFIEDAKKYYKGNVFAPYDLETFEIV